MAKLGGRHRATLDSVFADPVRSDVVWSDLEAKSMTMMHQDGYEAAVDYDDDAGLFHGEVVNLRDVITFQGRSVDELRRAFADSVADYIAYCDKRGEPPERPHTGERSVRLDPAVHRAVILAAHRSGVTPDEWVAQALARATA